MPGYIRKQSRQQAQQSLTFRQADFSGALNKDVPASKIQPNELPLIENLVAYPDRLEGRGGSLRYSATVLPGSGTIHSVKQNPSSRKVLLHRGSQLWIATNSLTSWTEVKNYSANSHSPTVTGTLPAVLSDITIRGTSSSNTDAGVLYVTYNALSAQVLAYKDAAKTQLVARLGVFDTTEAYNLFQANNSGIGGSVTVNSLVTSGTGTFICNIESSLNMDADSSIKVRNSDFFFFVKNVSSSFFLCHINSDDEKFTYMNSPYGIGYGQYKIPDSGTQSTDTPFGYRFLYTFTRILALDGTLDSTVDRRTGKLIFESPSNSTYTQSGLGELDYGEIWLANSIDDISYGLDLTVAGGPGGALFAKFAAGHYTHLSLYRTLNIGDTSNDPEVYIWDSDWEITTNGATPISNSDAILRSRIPTTTFRGQTLNTRGWEELSTGEVGELSNNFIYVSSRNSNLIEYGQIEDQQFIGFHHPLQAFNVDDGVQEMVRTTNSIIVLCNSKTKAINPTSYENQSTFEPVNIIKSFLPISDTLGVTDYGSISILDSDSFIARCTDHTIRVFKDVWQDTDYGNKIGSIIRRMMPGSSSAYFGNAFYIWYRTSSTDTYNTNCLRRGFGGDAGVEWTVVNGAQWIYPPLNVGGLTIFDSNNIQRLLAIDSTDSLFYWIETFDSYTGSNLSRIHKDKSLPSGFTGYAITPKLRFRELTGIDENHTSILQESHLHLRPYDASVGYLDGFSINLAVYVNGNVASTDTMTNVPANGDIQSYREAEGNRIQLEYTFSTSGFSIVSGNVRYQTQDKKNIVNDISTTSEYAYQIALASNLNHWFTRTNPIYFDSARGLNATASNLTTTTGPDGKPASAMLITGDNNAIFELVSHTYDSSFSIMFWIRLPVESSTVFRLHSDLYFITHDATSILVNGQYFTVSSMATGWHFFHVSRDEGSLDIYQNKTRLEGNILDPSEFDSTYLIIGEGQNGCLIYDFRVYSQSVDNNAANYLYDNVTGTDAGALVLPNF